MNELLAPVGSKEAFFAAIANGCDAIYLGLSKHNARAYADNFSLENLKEYVDFAHLRNVRVFVTLNTIVYDRELDEVYKMIDELAKINVDAIIVQDLAVLNYALNSYKSLEVHASTQMGIDDYYGAKFLKDLGVKRIVLARETPLEVIKDIKNRVNVEVETFIHGALCVSYSGNCFMSAVIGERSGNRGRCAGCCRKSYTLINTKSNKKINTGYLLSMKDLNLSNYIDKMKFVDSFKIEGRMKEDTYVAAVTNLYRNIIDKNPADPKDFEKVFNRTYTKGFINGEDSKDISNIKRPNNYGYLIGKVVKVHNNKLWIKLFSEVNVGDLLRIEPENSFEDINITLSKIYDVNMKVVDNSKGTIVVYCDKKVKVNTPVYKTKNIQFNKNLNLGKRIKEYKKLDINVEFEAHINEQILVKMSYKDHFVYKKSDFVVNEAINTPTTKEDIFNHFSKLNDTPYKINDFKAILDSNIFIPVKVINDLKRDCVEKLNQSRLNRKLIKNKQPKEIVPQKHEQKDSELVIQVSTKEQYEYVKSLGFKNIYFNNVVRRNNVNYIDGKKEVLIGGISSLEYYKNQYVDLVSDYSFNVNNADSAAFLSSKGVNRITLSPEINEENIKLLIKNYTEKYNTFPNLELIVYGRATLMHSKYCPLRRLGMCGQCKTEKFVLKDQFESFPITFNDDCTINLLNSKTLNLLDYIKSIQGINYFRIVFTTETKEEIYKVLTAAKDAITNKNSDSIFDGSKHTKGNFKKQLL